MKQKTKILLGFIPISISIPVAILSAEPIQWPVEDGGNGHWYERISEPLTWEEAKFAAEEHGGHLATITSQEEHDFTLQFSPGGAPGVTHIGARQNLKTGEWNWITDEPWNYTSWYPGEPNNNGGNEDYLTLWVTPGTWCDVNAQYQARYLVEYQDCNENGIFDGTEINDGIATDFNQNNIPDDCECLADVDENNVVDILDLLLVISRWEQPGPLGDIDFSGTVDISDLLYLINNWGECP
jgi:hypothetical protein